MSDRHPRDVQIVLVPIPVGGSNEPIRHVKPGKYPLQRRDPWRPASKPPQRGKAASIARLIENFQHQDRAIAEFMREARQPQK
jgi:hypothetical protein